jgi:hypothetical protein
MRSDGPRADAHAQGSLPVITGARGAVAWAAEALRRSDMPEAEIRALLSADDPEIVRRMLELHRERLDERVAEQRRRLIALEALLSETIASRYRVAS